MLGGVASNKFVRWVSFHQNLKLWEWCWSEVMLRLCAVLNDFSAWAGRAKICQILDIHERSIFIRIFYWEITGTSTNMTVHFNFTLFVRWTRCCADDKSWSTVTTLRSKILGECLLNDFSSCRFRNLTWCYKSSSICFWQSDQTCWKCASINSDWQIITCLCSNPSTTILENSTSKSNKPCFLSTIVDDFNYWTSTATAFFAHLLCLRVAMSADETQQADQ